MERRKRKLPVLCVEDDWHIRFVIAESLRSHGYEVVEAGNATQAEAFIRENKRGLLALVSDYDLMAGPTGADLIFETERRHVSVGIYILMSGKAKSDPEIQTYLSKGTKGLHHFLAKPFKVEDLLALLENGKHGRES